MIPTPPAAVVPPPPRAPAAKTASDWLVYGVFALLLAISFHPAEVGKFPLLFTNTTNMQVFVGGLLHPDFGHWRDYVAAMWLTVQIALWGTFLAIAIAVPFGVACSRNLAPPWIAQPARLLMNFLRAVPDLVVATIFIVAVGLGPFSGVMAIAVNTGGVLAKLFSEGAESIDPRPVEGIRATGGAPLHEIVWGVLPQVAPLWTSYSLYRFESNARSATVLGLIGAGGIGQLLFESLQAFQYRELSVIILVIVAAVTVIDLLSQALRARLL